MFEWLEYYHRFVNLLKRKWGKNGNNFLKTERNEGKTRRFCIKVLCPQFLQEKTPLTHSKGHHKYLRKDIILIPNKILRIQIKLRDSNANQIKRNQRNKSV